MSKAKLENGQLIYASHYMNEVSNPTNEMLTLWGYKDLVQSDTGETYEDETTIYVANPETIEITVPQQRFNAFKFDKNIRYKNVLMSVDEAVLNLQSYQVEGRTTEVEELQALIISAKAEIRERIK